MDEAALRRGPESANSRWDNTVAILTGDFLFARASDILADLGPEAVRIQARTFARLVQGQIRETVGPADGDDPLEHYLRVVADKTGSLIATSARFGALLAGASRRRRETLTPVGEQIGVAFQLSDDILDIASRVGGVGQDPRHRPARGRADPAGAAWPSARRPTSDARLRELLSADLTDDDAHAEALRLLRAHPAMDQARADAAPVGRRSPGGAADPPRRARASGVPRPLRLRPDPDQLGRPSCPGGGRTAAPRRRR